MKHPHDPLSESIKQRGMRLIVIGSGYVGLTTAALFADAGFRVVAFDKKIEITKAVNAGVSPLLEDGLGDIIRRNTTTSRLKGSSDPDVLEDRHDAVLIAVQTPIDSSGKPDISALSGALDDVGRNLRKGMLVIVISTVPVGTMSGFVKKRIETISHLRAESDFRLAYSPERMSPGNAVRELCDNPRIVGGIGPRSTKVAAEFFRTVCTTVIETDAKTAEVTKLAENAYRNTNIAFSNQLALICERSGVDSNTVIKLANTHPRVDILSPGPGAGGPCLRKDSMMLARSFKPRELNLVKTANDVNYYMATHVVDLVQQALGNAEKNPSRSRIAVLGTSYKRNVGDSRESPAERVIRRMLELRTYITTYDPHSRESFGGSRRNSIEECVKKSDGFVLMTDHSDFCNMQLARIKELMNARPFIIDARRVINPHHATSLGFEYFGIGASPLLSKLARNPNEESVNPR